MSIGTAGERGRRASFLFPLSLLVACNKKLQQASLEIGLAERNVKDTGTYKDCRGVLSLSHPCSLQYVFASALNKQANEKLKATKEYRAVCQPFPFSLSPFPFLPLSPYSVPV